MRHPPSQNPHLRELLAVSGSNELVSETLRPSVPAISDVGGMTCREALCP